MARLATLEGRRLYAFGKIRGKKVQSASVAAGTWIPASPNLVSTVGIAYSQSFANTPGAGGVAGPFTYSIVSGSVPTPLTMSSAGLLSGTPGAGTAGNYSFTVQSKNAAGKGYTKKYYMKVNP